MKNTKYKKIIALAFAAMMVFAVATTAFATAPSTNKFNCTACGASNTGVLVAATYTKYSTSQHFRTASYQLQCGNCKLVQYPGYNGYESHNLQPISGGLYWCPECGYAR